MNVKILSICKSPFSVQAFKIIIHLSYVSQVNMKLLKLVLLSLVVKQSHQPTAVALSFSKTCTV